MNPDDWKRFVMRSWIFALSDGETVSEFNASSENSRWRVSDTFSPGSTIPCQKHTRQEMLKEYDGTMHWIKMWRFFSRSGPTPGMAHSPQSFLLMDTNCRIGRLEPECLVFDPLASTFHLAKIRRACD